LKLYIRIAVNEVARAVYNLATTPDIEKCRGNIAHLEGFDKTMTRKFETLKSRMGMDEGAHALKRLLDTYGSYTLARCNVLALALQNQISLLDEAIQPRFSISALSGRMKWRKISGQFERFCGIPQTLHPCALLHRDSEM
jgi:hypothetical protein